jgi:hypothetical protein
VRHGRTGCIVPERRHQPLGSTAAGLERRRVRAGCRWRPLLLRRPDNRRRKHPARLLLRQVCRLPPRRLRALLR